MYSHLIRFEKFLPHYNAWVVCDFRTTPDAVALHLDALLNRAEGHRAEVRKVEALPLPII